MYMDVDGPTSSFANKYINVTFSTLILLVGVLTDTLYVIRLCPFLLQCFNGTRLEN